MTWRDDCWEVVSREWDVGEQFTLDDFYRFEGELTRKHPANSHVRDKMRQQLQVLRDEGRVRFVDDHGTYQRRR